MRILPVAARSKTAYIPASGLHDEPSTCTWDELSSAFMTAKKSVRLLNALPKDSEKSSALNTT